MMNTELHTSVLLEESIAGLNIQGDGVYLDGTFGRGGHSKGILSQLGETGLLVATDRDPQAIAFGRQAYASESRIVLLHTDFAAIDDVLAGHDLPQLYDGILLDLGVSSPQLDQAERGFSFMHDGPLDMRMDSSQGQTVADFLNNADESEIADVIYRLGDEKRSRRIAKAIVEQRIEQPLLTTKELVELIESVVTRVEKHKHPATRTFLALRMHVNDELGQIEQVLPKAIKMLKSGGRLAVISFHSREDRLVKRFFKQLILGPKLPKRMPVDMQYSAPIKLIGKAIKPSSEELAKNARARSAILRVIERTQVEYV